MSDDLIASLRELAAAQHSDLTVAADAADRIERLREVLKIVRINGPDAQGLVWLSFSREGGVRVSFVVGHKEKMVSQALLEFEQIRRNALETKA
jgi:hypothetical protein